MQYQTLKLQKNDAGFLTLTLNRPDVRNAFNEVLIEELTQAFKNEAQDASIRLIILQGEGPNFCAGGDLNWMKKSVSLSKEDNLKDTRKLTRLFSLMNEFEKPLIGLIHGAVIGGGVGLVSVCDIVLAEKQTVFSLSEVRLGLIPACIGPFVISKVGASHARALFISAERFTATRALEVGLVHSIHDGKEALIKASEKLISNMLECSPQALIAAKKLILNLSWPEKREEIEDCVEYVSRVLAELRVSPEGQEGVNAFLEKRKPNWIRK